MSIARTMRDSSTISMRGTWFGLLISDSASQQRRLVAAYPKHHLAMRLAGQEAFEHPWQLLKLNHARYLLPMDRLRIGTHAPPHTCVLHNLHAISTQRDSKHWIRHSMIA